MFLRPPARTRLCGLRAPFISLIGLVLISLLVFFHHRGTIRSWKESADTVPFRIKFSSPDEAVDYLAHTLGALFDEFAPSATVLFEKKNGIKGELWPTSKNEELVDVVELSLVDVLHMRECHDGFVASVSDKIPNFIPTKGAQPRGIITVGGGAYFPPLLVSLRLMRRTGTDLPVEVYMPRKDYEKGICEDVLPKLNAICRVFPDSVMTALDISKYQFKIFAILFSSFREVLWLDADNFPLYDSALLFDSDLFRDTGLITWPDLWQSSISPAYYLISSQDPVAISQRASTEAGQLLVSKKKHWKTLLLASYYNYFGPTHYYFLFCQSGVGCGDKDTFLPAAEALGLPFYDVKMPTEAVGHRKYAKAEDNIHRFALIQYDPIQDQAASKLKLNDAAASQGIRPFFLHMGTPKWDAYHVHDHVSAYDFTLDTQKKKAAAFRDPPSAARKIQGVERMVWEETLWTACNLEDIIGYWEGKRGHICENNNRYFEELLDTEEAKELGLHAEAAMYQRIGGL
jgi:alpha 1,2-mannosyltransferase